MPSELGGVAKELVGEGVGHAAVTFGVGVEEVGVGVTEVAVLTGLEGVEAADGVEVDDGHGPDGAGFTDGLDVLVDVLAHAVCP